MEKKRVIVSYKNLKPEVLEIMQEQYPYGYSDDIIKVDKGNNQHFYAVIVDTEDVKYLVKVDVKIDMLIEEQERRNNNVSKSLEKENKNVDISDPEFDDEKIDQELLQEADYNGDDDED